MFFGGLNGDGFFGEEYGEWGEYDNSPSYSDYKPRKAYSTFEALGLRYTDVSTEKAVLLEHSNSGMRAWLPKSAVNGKNVMLWAMDMLVKNLKASALKEVND